MTSLRILVALVLGTLWTGAAHSAAPGAIPEDEISKQSAIYQSRGEDVPKGYVTGRSLSSYLLVLPSEFKGSLAKLGAADRWLDIGAGEGRAILDYCTSRYDGTLLQGLERRGGKA